MIETNKQRIIEKIRALLSKTVDAGCTEAEAMAAAAKAAQLMDEYAIDQTVVEIGASEAMTRDYDMEHDDPVGYCANAVAAFTETRVWKHTETKWKGGEDDLFGQRGKVEKIKNVALRFLGLPHDVEIAGYLIAICDRALEAGAVAYRAEFGTRPARDIISGFAFGTKGRGTFDPTREFAANLRAFQLGMAQSMSTTLYRMKHERQKANSNGRELVVAKNGLIQRWLDDRKMTFGPTSTARMPQDHAYYAGRKAGEGVRFNPGVGGSSDGRTLRIAAR